MKDEKFKQKVIQQVLKRQEADQGKDPFDLFANNPFTTPVELDTPCPRCGSELKGSRMGLSALSGVVRCTKCEFKDGLTSFLMKQVFPVQPMPEGAKAIYAKEEEDSDDNE